MKLQTLVATLMTSILVVANAGDASGPLPRPSGKITPSTLVTDAQCEWLTQKTKEVMAKARAQMDDPAATWIYSPGGEYWQKTSQPIGKDEYQNGAFWGTACGWVAYAIAQADPSLASKMMGDLIDYCRNRGAFECINKDGIEKLGDYGATVGNPLSAIRRMREEK